jgi:hypothetical protein
MYTQKTQKVNYSWLMLPAVFLLLVISGTWIFANGPIWAADEQGEHQEYPDRAGREALRLWYERERDRAMASAARRYWDYWLLWPPRRYLWRAPYYPPYLYPSQHPYPYSYPYSYYYPPSYYAAPQMGPPPPYYVYPGIPEKHGGHGG